MAEDPLLYIAGLALLLALFVIGFFWYRDKYEREPPIKLLVAFGIGCLTTIPAIILNSTTILFLGEALDPEIGYILVVCAFAPFFEEAVKGLGFYTIRNDREMDGMMDGLVYGACVGAGFAFVENIMYGLNMYSMTGGDVALEAALGLVIFRSLMMPIGHSLYTGLTGSEFGKSKLPQGIKGSPWIGFGMAVGLHSIWNTTATIIGSFGDTMPDLAFLLLLVIGFYIWLLNKKSKEALAYDKPGKVLKE